jgi:predicted dehydrogenase
VAVAEFENGVIGIGETSFVTYSSPEMIEIYGSEGTLISCGGDVKFTSSKIREYVDGWVKPAIPKSNPIPIIQFVDACINGTGSPEGLGIDDALALTELLENAYIGDENNKIVVR